MENTPSQYVYHLFIKARPRRLSLTPFFKNGEVNRPFVMSQRVQASNDAPGQVFDVPSQASVHYVPFQACDRFNKESILKQGVENCKQRAKYAAVWKYMSRLKNVICRMLILNVPWNDNAIGVHHWKSKLD